MHNFSDFILTNDNKPTTALKNILNYCAINPDQPLNALIAQTQKQWLRPASSERWHLQETRKSDQKTYLLTLFKEIGLVQQFDPRGGNYDYILFMGGDLPGMQERLAYMLSICQEKIIPRNLVFLTAERPLDPEHESAHLDFENQPKTEYELLRFLYEHAQLPLSLSSIAPIYINTPNQMRNNRICRATTPDTLIEWLKERPIPGSCLVISSQPLIGYQNSVTHTLLSKKFIIESVGPEASLEISTDEYLDTLARWLYQEGILRKVTSA